MGRSPISNTKVRVSDCISGMYEKGVRRIISTVLVIIRSSRSEVEGSMHDTRGTLSRNKSVT